MTSSFEIGSSVSALFSRPQGENHWSAGAIQVVVQVRQCFLAFVVLKAIQTQLDYVGNFSRAGDRVFQVSCAPHANWNTNLRWTTFHQTQREAMFVCFLEKHVIAPISDSNPVHSLRQLLITAHRIEVSRGRLRPELPGDSFHHPGNRIHPLSTLSTPT